MQGLNSFSNLVLVTRSEHALIHLLRYMDTRDLRVDFYGGFLGQASSVQELLKKVSGKTNYTGKMFNLNRVSNTEPIEEISTVDLDSLKASL